MKYPIRCKDETYITILVRLNLSIVWALRNLTVLFSALFFIRCKYFKPGKTLDLTENNFFEKRRRKEQKEQRKNPENRQKS